MAQKIVIIWTQPAIEDVEEIADYIAVDNPRAAKTLVAKIFASVDHLTHFPNLGRKVAELPSLPYRELVVHPCRVIYRVEEGKAFIVLVLRAEQLMEEHRLWRFRDN